MCGCGCEPVASLGQVCVCGCGCESLGQVCVCGSESLGQVCVCGCGCYFSLYWAVYVRGQVQLFVVFLSQWQIIRYVNS